MDIRLATCSYTEFRPHMGVPVRFTAGPPRWPLSYQLAGHAKLITPRREMLSLPIDAYTLAYRRMLHMATVDRIAAELVRICGTPDEPIVLLCFERLNEPGKWCHRTIFAAWWLDKTGHIVAELGAHPAHRGPVHEQPSLLDTE